MNKTQPSIITDNKGNTSPKNFNSNSGTQVKSIYNESIPEIDIEQVNINELKLVLDALNLIKGKWTGEGDLPLNINDFDQNKLKSYYENEAKKSSLLTIPKEEESLYLTNEAKEEITSIIWEARDEYINYIKDKGVNNVYINAFENIALPKDLVRITYYPVNDPNSPPTSVSVYTEGGEKDFRAIKMEVYPVDIYNYTGNIEKSQIIDHLYSKGSIEYKKEVRNLGLRQLIYHELTHVLQRSYFGMHISEDKIERGKTNWVYADKNITLLADTKYFWKWGNSTTYQETNNKKIGEESQADGISFEILSSVYNMSYSQKNNLWESCFGRLNNSRKELGEIKNLFEISYPSYNPEDFGHLLSNVADSINNLEDKRMFRKISTKFSFVASYIGYINPIRPEDTNKFWELLKSI